MPEQGDIVPIPVPFTDLSAQKRRPVIVVSNDVYNFSIGNGSSMTRSTSSAR